MTASGPSTANVEGCNVIEEWRQSLSELQRTLIQHTWQTFLRTGDWALLRPSYQQHGKRCVVQELSKLAGFVSEEEDHRRGNSFRLLLPGVLLTLEGARYLEMLERYFRFQRKLFETEPELREIESAEIGARLELTAEETRILGHLLYFGNESGGYQTGMKSWTVRTMKEAEDFAYSGGMADVVTWIRKSYRPLDPVFVEERRQKQLIDLSTPILSWSSNSVSSKRESSRQDEGNPFQRRYQVFVSSTYNDLIEERKHVMQALLETKCIPAGMELFPAASTEQMKLIESIIDDCDYYLVIVAGKYGSCGSQGISYTEMEFNYAVKTGKPILAFFHSDIKKLPGEKLEDNDTARRALTAFTEKIKHQRLCRSWSTCDGLASAIKTAIIHAIETNPKPGWVRADSVPTWNMVQSLDNRIAELEGRRSEFSEKLPAGQDRLDVPAQISWKQASDTNGRSHQFKRTFSLSWDELFLHIAPEPGISTSRLGLLRSFGYSLAKTLEGEIKSAGKDEVFRLGGTVDSKIFNDILQTLLALGLFKHVPPPRRVRCRMMYWQLSSKGIHKLSALRAIRSARNSIN